MAREGQAEARIQKPTWTRRTLLLPPVLNYYDVSREKLQTEKQESDVCEKR